MSSFRKYNVFLYLYARPRLIISAALGLLLFYLLPDDWRLATRRLVAWDSAVALYLVLVGWLAVRADIAQIRRYAAAEDEGRFFILILITTATFCSIAAILAELTTAKESFGTAAYGHIGLAALTIFLSWSFMHMMYALHYAHEYYSDGADAACGGLEFPGTAEPDYADFMYFSFIIGTAAQTADVDITSRSIRRIATLHCILAFFFNTTILALSINIGASLLN